MALTRCAPCTTHHTACGYTYILLTRVCHHRVCVVRRSVLRRTIGVIFWSLTRAAKRIGQRAGPHYRAVCADAEFYDGWLAPKIEAFFRARRAAAAGKA